MTQKAMLSHKGARHIQLITLTMDSGQGLTPMVV